MSIEKNRQEADRWLRTAEDDLDTSIVLKNNGKFAHSCFHAQQAAEKAVKAITTPDTAFMEEDSTACIEAARNILQMVRTYLDV